MAFSLDDAIGLNDLTNNGSVVGAAGHTGLAAQFDGSNYLSISDNSDLSVSDDSFYLDFWVYFASVSGVQGVVSKWSSSGTDRLFAVYLGVESAGRLDFRVVSSGGFDVAVASSVDLSVDTWYHVRAGYDKPGTQIYIDVDSTVDYASYTDTITDDGSAFIVGRDQGSTFLSSGSMIDDLVFAKGGGDVASWNFGTGGGGGSAPVVSLAASTSSIVETSGVSYVIATLDQTASASVTVGFSVSGVAGLGTDYTLSTDSITIASGQLSGSISATSVSDSVYEGNENFAVAIATVTGGGASASATASSTTVTIVDGQSAPVVTISVSPSSIAENGGVAVVTAVLSNASTQDVSVNFSFSGTATNNTDYSRSATAVTINAGSTSGSISITAIQDATYDGNETVIVDVSSVTNGTENGSQQVTVTIIDDEVQPTVNLSASTTTIAENAGVAYLAALLSHASYQEIQCGIEFLGQAAYNFDYSRSGILIGIPAGSTSGSISITALQDALDEDSETITVQFGTIINGTAGATNSLSFTITDDDASPTVTISASATTISENAGTAYFLATLSAPSGRTASFTVNVATGTATDGLDFSASTTSFFWPAGTTTASIGVTSLADILFESNETIVLLLSSPTNCAAGSPFSASITIVNEYMEPFVSLSASTASISENGGSSTVFATLDHTHSADVTVVVAFTGSATLNTDYSRTTNSIVIVSGASSGSISITALQESVGEANETVIVSISNVTNGTAASAASVTTISIVDDDSRASGISGLHALSGLSGIC
jgi:hypothetical protein